MGFALAEAHRYVDQSLAATSFTERLLTTIREQRHIRTWFVISRQEPTISEKLLDLCSISIVHYFKSPACFRKIRDHVGGASDLVNSDKEQVTLFEQIGTLPAVRVESAPLLSLSTSVPPGDRRHLDLERFR